MANSEVSLQNEKKHLVNNGCQGYPILTSTAKIYAEKDAGMSLYGRAWANSLDSLIFNPFTPDLP